MVKVILKIDGMMCGMCESHINDAIRQNFDIKKVKSNHSKGETVIVAETEPDEDKLYSVINATGYALTGITKEPFQKKRFGLF